MNKFSNIFYDIVFKASISAIILMIVVVILRVQIADFLGAKLGLTYEYQQGSTITEVTDFFEDAIERGYGFCFVKSNGKEHIYSAMSCFESKPKNFSINTYYTPLGNDYYVVYFYNYLNSKEMEYEWNECNRIADSIIEGMPEGLTKEEQLLYAHNYLCEANDSKVSANSSTYAKKRYNMYTLFTEGRSVCEGYTQAYSLLLTKLGVENTIITADYGKINHVWNCYELNGSTYYTDVTWDDCCGDENGVIYDNTLGIYADVYFNKDGSEFMQTHKFSEYTPAVIENKVVHKD